MASFFGFRPVGRLGAVLVLSSVASCSVSDQVSESASLGAPPTQVRTDADRRALYNGNGAPGGSAVPDATPNRVRLGEQAADINREKRIENINTDDPNTSTPETRLKRLNQNAPAPPDTVRRR